MLRFRASARCASGAIPPPARHLQGVEVRHLPPGDRSDRGARRRTGRRVDRARNPSARPPVQVHGRSHPATAQKTEDCEEQRISDPRTNDKIRVPEVRLVGPAGEQVGVVPIESALRLAREADLDLVEVAPNSRPPVVKIMDYGKFKYETAQKAKEARRNQANTVLKEVRFRLKIDSHDYETKRKRAEGFLKDGDKVKAMILFRGREQSRPDQGVRLLARFAEDVREFGNVESNPTIDGRNMVMVVGPVKSKVDAKAEQNAKRAAARNTTAPTGADDAPTSQEQ